LRVRLGSVPRRRSPCWVVVAGGRGGVGGGGGGGGGGGIVFGNDALLGISMNSMDGVASMEAYLLSTRGSTPGISG